MASELCRLGSSWMVQNVWWPMKVGRYTNIKGTSVHLTSRCLPYWNFFTMFVERDFLI